MPVHGADVICSLVDCQACVCTVYNLRVEPSVLLPMVKQEQRGEDETKSL